MKTALLPWILSLYICFSLFYVSLISYSIFSVRLKYMMLTDKIRFWVLNNSANGIYTPVAINLWPALSIYRDPSYLSYSSRCSCTLFMDILTHRASRYLVLRYRFSKLSFLGCYEHLRARTLRHVSRICECVVVSRLLSELFVAIKFRTRFSSLSPSIAAGLFRGLQS